MTAMSMIVTGAVFAQETPGKHNNESKHAASAQLVNGTVTAIRSDLAEESMPGAPFINGQFGFSYWSLPYEGGNGGAVPQLTVQSQGVLGLTLEHVPFDLAVGNNWIAPFISGTATSSGIASFPISFGGKSCTLEIPVL